LFGKTGFVASSGFHEMGSHHSLQSIGLLTPEQQVFICSTRDNRKLWPLWKVFWVKKIKHKLHQVLDLILDDVFHSE